jgi:peptide/nickel transport system permease protein
MLKYIIKRILMIVLIVLCVTFIIFVLLYSLPSSRISAMPIYGGGDALDTVFTFLRASDNIVTKFIRYCFNIIAYMDFGLTSGWPLIDELRQRATRTLILLTGGVGATLLIGIPAGMYAAVRKDSWGDRVISFILLLLSSIPPYWLCFSSCNWGYCRCRATLSRRGCILCRCW